MGKNSMRIMPLPLTVRFINNKQDVRECTCTAGTIPYIDNIFLDKQYTVCIG